MNAVTPATIETQVLIAGAGPVGQGLGIELGMRGISCLVIDKNERVGVAPRAKTTNVRSREHMRRWGIAQALRDASPLGISYPSNIVFTTRLAGHQLAKFDNALYCAPGRNPLYAEHAQWIPQYTVEQVMRDRLLTLPSASLRLRCELLGFEQDADGVTARVKDSSNGAELRVRARYLAGCDGPRSIVRDAIGAKLEGKYGLSRNYNFVFRAPGLAQAHKHGPAIQYWQINGEVPSLLGPMDSGDRWFFMPTGLAPDVKLGKEDAPALIRRATGIDLPYEILSADEWVASQLLATHYRDRRVFLAGDAAHMHPPFGGFGMNMGIGDAVDLGWKLAAVLQGWGGTALLDSYERERRPVHVHVLEQATHNHSLVTNALLEEGIEDGTAQGEAARRRVGQRIEQGKLPEFYTLGTILGDCYTDSPVIDRAGCVERPRDFLKYVPWAEPGFRAPHVWLHDGSSLYDHFGMGLTLLLSRPGAQASSAAAQAQEEAQRLGIALTVFQPESPGVAALYGRALTLIRPDQHIAWTGDVWAPGAIARACGLA
jgi:2-polyprenyl-6-methoxyphenol hydroxylase-like FAD-dependent oxidoreductase